MGYIGAPSMQSIIVLILFVGFACIVHGIYEERVRALQQDVRVEYRFLPRTLYDEQLEAPDLAGKFRGMFDAPSADPWADSHIGRDIGDALQPRTLQPLQQHPPPQLQTQQMQPDETR
jgi:hypothetical protein